MTPCIVILTHQKDKALLALQAARYLRLPIVLIDVGLEGLDSIPSGTTLIYIKSDQPKTVAEAVNHGISAIQSDFFLVNDATVDTIVNLSAI